VNEAANIPTAVSLATTGERRNGSGDGMAGRQLLRRHSAALWLSRRQPKARWRGISENLGGIRRLENTAWWLEDGETTWQRRVSVRGGAQAIDKTATHQRGALAGQRRQAA